WRAAAASAVAGAIACGIIALMVSRGGAMLLQGAASRLSRREQQLLRGACGYVAGAIFGFNGAFWGRVLVADAWSLSILLLVVVLCLLMRWFYGPDRRLYLHSAFFVFGLTFTNSQMLFASAPALLLIAALGDAKL